MAAVSEALIQPFVYRYKQQLGSPYDLSDAATRIALSGIGGGAIAGTLKAAGKLVARSRVDGVDDLLETFERHSSGATQVERDAAHVLGDYADTLRETPFEIGHPDLDDVHLRATAKAIADVEAGRPVDVAEIIPQQPRQMPAPEQRVAPVPTEIQSLGQFIKNQGGVSIALSGDLRGEFEGLFEGGGRKAGVIKRVAGRSPDDLSQLAHESGYIEAPDTILLKEALERDLAGEKVYTPQGDAFERKMDIQIERDFQRWAEAEEVSYYREVDARARAILETEDLQIPTGELLESEGGALTQVTRSARELIGEADRELKIGQMLKSCMTGGAS
jgi:hypothetical protein